MQTPFFNDSLAFHQLCVHMVVVTPVLQVRYHEDFEKNKGSFTPTTTDLVTERVKRNTQDFSDISYRGIQRRVVEMERRRALEHDQETITGALTTRTPKRSIIAALWDCFFP